MSHNNEEQDLIDFLNDDGLNPAMITAMLYLGGLAPTRDLAQAVIDYREHNIFTSSLDLLRVSGFGEQRKNALLSAIGLGGHKNLSGRMRKYLDVWEAPVSQFASTSFHEIELGDTGPIQMSPSDVAYVVVHYGDWFWVFNRSEITSVAQIEAIRHQENPRLVCSGVPIRPDLPARTAFKRMGLKRARMFVLVKNGNVEGVVTPGSLFTPQPILASAELGTGDGADWPKEPPAEDFQVISPQAPYQCAILLYKVRGRFSELVDKLTGKKGYSHTAVYGCERDGGTGAPLIIDTTLPNGVHRKRFDCPFYAERDYYRVDLDLNDSAVLYENLVLRMGRTFDIIDFWNDNGPDDPAGSVCSQNAFECLPGHLQDRIRDAVDDLRLGPIGQQFHDANPSLVSPNQIAEAFGAPNAHTM